MFAVVTDTTDTRLPSRRLSLTEWRGHVFSVMETRATLHTVQWLATAAAAIVIILGTSSPVSYAIRVSDYV